VQREDETQKGIGNGMGMGMKMNRFHLSVNNNPTGEVNRAQVKSLVRN
jgi:hypothetical protein